MGKKAIKGKIALALSDILTTIVNSNYEEITQLNYFLNSSKNDVLLQNDTNIMRIIIGGVGYIQDKKFNTPDTFVKLLETGNYTLGEFKQFINR